MFKIKLFLILLNFLIFEKMYANVTIIDSDSVSVNLRIWKVEDINRKMYLIKNKIAVFIFLDVECPISQYYTKTLQKIFLKYHNEEIVFFTVFPTKYVHKDEIVAFNQKYDLSIPSVLDKFQRITNKLNATVTPEVFVINQDNKVLYFGSIDDSYFALGKRNLNQSKYYLIDVLDSVIKDKKPLIAHVQAIGCEIQRIP